MPTNSALDVRNVSVRFGGIAALNGVSLSAEAGAVTGLMGPNGAGKTTLFNVISGMQHASAGEVFINGSELGRRSPAARAKLGLARTFQRLELFGSLTAIENVMVGLEARRGIELHPHRRAGELMEMVGILEDAPALASSLPTGKARLVELARALAMNPKVLLLDEPSSGLDEAESMEMGKLLREVAAEGCAVVLVEHDIDLMMSVCDAITFLDFGEVLTTGSSAEVKANEAVQQAYLVMAPDAA